MKYVDFHTHVDDVDMYSDLGVYALVNCMTLEEVVKWLPVSQSNPYIKLSIGVHPNHPEDLEDLLPFYNAGQVIGEIGLDNCWSEADLDKQRHSFIESLKVAELLNKPIILHTKGMGGEIFKVLQAYKMPKIIHWFSDDISLVKAYPLDNAYYTIGPDVRRNSHVQALVNHLSPQEMLVETDGLNALAWALGKVQGPEAIVKALDDTIDYICKVKDVSKEEFMDHIFTFYKSL